MGGVHTAWLRESRASAGEFRLVCFPHAGAGASAYREWAGLLAPAVRVVAVQLPGREDRIREAGHERIGPLLDDLMPALRALTDGPFAFFGHSMGALIAFEAIRRLRADALPLPDRLFVSGRAAPDTPDVDAHIARLPSAQFRAALGRLNGFPPAVFADATLMSLLEPALRADFALCENYRYQPGPPLPMPITVFGGTEDDVVPAFLSAWRRHTATSCVTSMVPGDHSFVMSRAATVTAAVREALIGATQEVR